VPELAEAAKSCSAKDDPLTCPDWEEITLGALASHLAGLGRGRPVSPAPTAIGGLPITSFGLPPKPEVELLQCEKQPCTRAESLRAFLQEAPVSAAFSTPIYSNGAYQILTYALEAITNRSISDMITDDVFCPLNMEDSSYAFKANASGIIPKDVMSSFWNAPLGDAGATGGMYSSSRDMVKLGQSILTNKQLSPTSTRKWLRPWANTAVWQQAMGLAWEIARWPVNDRIVDIYTKQGDLGRSLSLPTPAPHPTNPRQQASTTPASLSSPPTLSASSSSPPAPATLPRNPHSSTRSSPTSSPASMPPPNLKPLPTSPAPTPPPTKTSTQPSP
jgi:CubicO group peptidase (beta-lactamase class C family)